MLKLKRYSHNPILKPRSDVWWEALAVCNPGVIYDNDKFTMLYRAMGGDRISRFGIATSQDGYKFSCQKDYPVFESDASEKYERLGCEDPRITKIEDTYYVTYVSASVHPATYPKEQFATSMLPWRVRVSLLSTKDFSSFHRYGVIIHGIDSKNPVLYPEKIDNQYVLLHRIHPDIWITFSKDLTNWYDDKAIVRPRKNSWDSLKIGAGAPPIKTKLGWLVFYHGVDSKFTYRLGVLLFDLNDPSKLIYRSKNPILEPIEDYEKEGFEKYGKKSISNIVFTSGAVEKNDELFIYYGASDKFIGLATVKKDELLSYISKDMR